MPKETAPYENRNNINSENSEDSGFGGSTRSSQDDLSGYGACQSEQEILDLCIEQTIQLNENINALYSAVSGSPGFNEEVANALRILETSSKPISFLKTLMRDFTNWFPSNTRFDEHNAGFRVIVTSAFAALQKLERDKNPEVYDLLKRNKAAQADNSIPAAMTFHADTGLIISEAELAFLERLDRLSHGKLTKIPRANLAAAKNKKGTFAMENYLQAGHGLDPIIVETIRAVLLDPKQNVMQHSVVQTDTGDMIALFHDKAQEGLDRNGKKKTSAIGRGGFADTRVGQIIGSETQDVGSIVAVKVTRDAQKNIEITERERDFLQILNVGNYGWLSRSNKDYLPQAWAPGQSLRTANNANSDSVEKRIRDAIAVADAIQYFHDRGIIHADIKPENIQILHGVKGVQARLIDLGFCVQKNEGEAFVLVGKNVARGTKGFAAPELHINANANANAKVEVKPRLYSYAGDVFAFGETLKEMFSARSDLTKVDSAISLPTLSHYDPQLVSDLLDFYVPSFLIKSVQDEDAHAQLYNIALLIKACTDEDPSKRPTIEEARNCLEHILAEKDKPMTDIAFNHPEYQVTDQLAAQYTKMGRLRFAFVKKLSALDEKIQNSVDDFFDQQSKRTSADIECMHIVNAISDAIYPLLKRLFTQTYNEADCLAMLSKIDSSMSSLAALGESKLVDIIKADLKIAKDDLSTWHAANKTLQTDSVKPAVPQRDPQSVIAELSHRLEVDQASIVSNRSKASEIISINIVPALAEAIEWERPKFADAHSQADILVKLNEVLSAHLQDLEEMPVQGAVAFKDMPKRVAEVINKMNAIEGLHELPGRLNQEITKGLGKDDVKVGAILRAANDRLAEVEASNKKGPHDLKSHKVR